MASITLRFRINKELHQKLAKATEGTGKGKNAIIVEALTRYLESLDRAALAAEARCQSELVSAHDAETSWYELADTSGWR